ncbi:hypothetical protein [Streptomyces sp. V1I1]|uniref:hypothetical protein n=1 Tax=Streptomyces sp. V1I1 TaxID=3042272 RepID=UPI002788B373|nr:hypothetical protein [Streptomyces sp. V1I1]MDQ0939333.1 hypothetical protein [Streptomyces sp. V1I1]
MTRLPGRWLPLTVLVAAVAMLIASIVWVAGSDFGRPGRGWTASARDSRARSRLRSTMRNRVPYARS